MQPQGGRFEAGTHQQIVLKQKIACSVVGAKAKGLHNKV
jgi:hypothetical protein